MALPRFPNHYDTLRVDRYASAQQVRLAYRRLAGEFHPDRYQGPGNAAELMAQINQAYEALSEPGKRIVYDNWLSTQEGRRPQPVRGSQAATGLANLAGNLAGNLSGAAVASVRAVVGVPSYKLAGTIALSLGVAGFALVRTLTPANASLQMMPADAALHMHVMDPVPLVPARQLQAWAPAARRAAYQPPEAAEPGLRLVREGMMKSAPAWRSQHASAE